MATTQSKSFKGGAIAGGTGLNGTVLPINTDNDGNVTNNGNLLTVTGNNAWAEGERTKATAGRAHAEGYMTEASAADAHAEGSNTKASAAQSHAEGAGTIASGQGSHAEGGACVASGDYSHASGEGTRATDRGSTAVGRFNSDGTALFVVGNGVSPDEGDRADVFKVDRLGRSYVKNEAGNLVKVRGAGVAIFTASRSGGIYTYPNADDVIAAISNYDEVIIRLVSSMEGIFNYVYEYSSIANEYRWIREDGTHVITLTGAGSPLVWTWTTGGSKLKQDVASLDTDIGKVGGSIALAYDYLTFPIAEGTLCMYARRLYTCTASGGIPASEDWDFAHWTQTRVSDIIGNVEQLLAAL